jgi:predicted lipid carrier protein YhbT
MMLPSLPTLPAFTLPAPVAAFVRRLPMAPPSWLVARALDFGVGRVVAADAVVPLAGRRFRLQVVDAGLDLHVRATANGFAIADPTQRVDLTVAATLRDFIALALREEDPDTLFFARRLVVEGDTALGLTVKNLLDGIDWATLLRPSAWLAGRCAGGGDCGGTGR